MNEGLGHTVLIERAQGGATTSVAASRAKVIPLERKTAGCADIDLFKALVAR